MASTKDKSKNTRDGTDGVPEFSDPLIQILESDSTKADGKPLIPVTAIGASAGGLDPIEQFFDAMPVDSGCAFVIIQHLSPDFRSLMDELLARHSSMEIHRITEGMEITPNTIYLNTPRTVMTIDGNFLRAKKVDPKSSVYLPINIFFKSLAQSRKDQAIGLILSGTGSDGTLGSKSIAEQGGTVLIQDPETTRFDGMPRSVISNGIKNLVASPTVLAECVERLLKNEPLDGLGSGERRPLEDPYADVLSMLKFTFGTDFEQYKDATIKRRIERRAQMRGISEIAEYRDVLSSDNNELTELYADLLIEVTEFFRDKEAFRLLDESVIASLIDSQKEGGSVRVWVPGCASGEEAYSIAILLHESARRKGMHLNLKIMATDIHVRSMKQASSGIYDESSLKNVPEELVERYFDCADGQAQIKPQLRNMVFFSTHDLTRDPPFTRIDLISCRNLLIYLNEAAQEKIMTLLHFALRKDGYLFLGPSEHIGAIDHEFEPINDQWRIYKKLRDVKLLASDSIFHGTDIGEEIIRASASRRVMGDRGTLSSSDPVSFKLAHKAALESIVEKHAPPGFLLSEDGTIIHIFGNAWELTPMQSGSFSRRIVDMIRPELKSVVTTALDNGRSPDFTTFSRTAQVRLAGQDPVNYKIDLEKVMLPGNKSDFQLLTIESSERSHKDESSSVTITQNEIDAFDSSEEFREQITVLRHNLKTSEESLQSTIEELETSNEELQSTNEELMSTNEELQSTNEELHSVNEELYTVSAEHRRKNEELTEKDTDIDLLLQQSRIGTMHLDEELRLQRYSNNARGVFNILPQDVGRPISHITIRAPAENFFDLVDRVNQKHETHEVQMLVESEVFIVRIMPYRPKSEDEGGVLIAVIDVSDFEKVRSELADLNIRYKDILEKTETFFVRWDADTGRINYCNASYAQRWQATPADLTGRNIFELQREEIRDNFKESFVDYEPNELRAGVDSYPDMNGTTRWEDTYTRAISADGLKITEFQINGQDCTEEHKYRESIERLFSVLSDDSLDFKPKIDHLLDIGLSYLDLSSAIFGNTSDEEFQLKGWKTTTAIPYNDKENLTLTDIQCSDLIRSESVLSIDNLSDSDLAKAPIHTSAGVESFIGAAVRSSVGHYGAVGFYSRKARNRLFSQRDESFVILISSWLGFLVENQKQSEFMHKQTDHYKELFHNIPVMMFLCDKSGNIISASERLCEKLELEREAILGKNCLSVFKVDDKTELQAALARDNVLGQPFSLANIGQVSCDVEMNSRVKSVGTLQDVRMVVLNDVTERNIALQRAEDQNQRLEAANENLNRFAFIASHDLQEPLRKIQQFSSFLEEDLVGQLTEDGRLHLDIIVDASARMSTLIYDLLRFSGASTEEPKMEKIALGILLNEVLEELQLSIEEAGASVELGSLPEVEGDKALIRQLFTNLVGNSIKYRSAARSLLVKIDSYKEGSSEGVEISDNGIGFEMEFSKKIFEPFNRLHGAKEYKGNGIGLAICSTVCDKHNWKLSAQGVPDTGSTFRIAFSGD